jgi:hypothetical protein
MLLVNRQKRYRLFLHIEQYIASLVTKLILSQRRLEQVPELIILTNSKSFENLKLKRKEKKRRREHIIYNKYNVCVCYQVNTI